MQLSNKSCTAIGFSASNSVKLRSFVAEYFMAATFDYDEPYNDAEAYLLSPELNIISEKCLSFVYYIRSDLNVSLINQSDTLSTILSFHINSGEDFHEAFLELPMGSYQIKWNVGYVPEAAVRETDDDYFAYWAIIDDVMVHDVSCDDLRKSIVAYGLLCLSLILLLP